MTFEAVQAFDSWLTPALYAFGIGIIVLETAILKARKLPRDKAARWLSVWNGALAFGAEAVVHATLLLGLQMWVYEHRLFDLGFDWWVFGLSLLLSDAMFYVSHRAGHEIRLLWAIHCVHHSPKNYDLTTGIRGSALGALMNVPFVVWIPLLGIHPLVFFIMDRLFKFYGLAYHTEAIGKLGWLDRVLITPSVHRVHHATNPQYLDRNYGGLFLFFDRLLGTWEPEDEKPVYGLVKDWNGTTVWDCQTHEIRDLWADMRAAPSFWTAAQYALRRPGWTPSRKAIADSASPHEYPPA